jgi:hypothetical protein
MAINIKNERTVALARELAEARGTTLTSAIEEALETRLAQVRNADAATAAERVARRRTAAATLLAELSASITPQQRDALRTAQVDMYDEDGLPVW